MASDRVGSLQAAARALRELVDTIEATGGVEGSIHYGGLTPVADEDWTDLAAAYMSACEALEVEPLVNGSRAWSDGAR